MLTQNCWLIISCLILTPWKSSWSRVFVTIHFHLCWICLMPLLMIWQQQVNIPQHAGLWTSPVILCPSLSADLRRPELIVVQRLLFRGRLLLLLYQRCSTESLTINIQGFSQTPMISLQLHLPRSVWILNMMSTTRLCIFFHMKHLAEMRGIPENNQYWGQGMHVVCSKNKKSSHSLDLR